MNPEIIRQLAGLLLFIGPLALGLSCAARFVSRDGFREGVPGVAIFWWFCLYIGLLATLTLAPPPMSMSNGSYGTRLIPLIYSARCFVPNPGQPSTSEFCVRTIFGNIAIFIPLGLMLPLLSRSLLSIRKVLNVAVVASVSIEILQFAGRWFGSYRWSDVDDVIFNVTGAALGYGLLMAAVALSRPITRVS